MPTLRTLTLALLLAGFFGTAGADTLNMQAARPDGSERPNRGMTQQGVEAKYGSPDSKVAAVGDPPISRWEYKDMVVFFEYDRVIHAVLKR